jgi:hypothetical protein
MTKGTENPGDKLGQALRHGESPWRKKPLLTEVHKIFSLFSEKALNA